MPSQQLFNIEQLFFLTAYFDSVPKENGLPATPKGRRNPEVSFLVLLSLCSILPTRTI